LVDREEMEIIYADAFREHEKLFFEGGRHFEMMGEWVPFDSKGKCLRDFGDGEGGDEAEEDEEEEEDELDEEEENDDGEEEEELDEEEEEEDDSDDDTAPAKQ